MKIIPIEGKNFLLEKYLLSTDLYLGLWSSTTSEFPRLDINLSSWSKVYEISFNEYSRKKVSKVNWIYNASLGAYENTEFSFLPQTQNWTNVRGYFITTSNDNTGDLFTLVAFDSAKTFLKGLVEAELVIVPRYTFV